MREKHLRSWPLRLTSLVAAAAVVGAGVVPGSAMAASPAAAHRAGAAVSALRSFDAVTTVNERNVWKHMALIGDQYAIYNDFGLIQGPTSIRLKWPFLPEEFTRDIDAAGIGFSGPGFRWRHTWTKGNQAIIFEDTGIIAGPFAIPGPYDGLSDYNNSPRETSRIFHLAVRGGKAAYFFDQNFAVPTSSLPGLSFIPARFNSDLDDVSVEIQSDGTKMSYYKGNERLIFNDRGQILEIVNLDAKWPFLNSWRAGG